MQGAQTISLPKNAVLVFSHPSVTNADGSKKPLYIHSGANSIKWSYHLNTVSTPTIGGEVIQVLSALVGPLTIEGMTAGLGTDQDPREPLHGYLNAGGRLAYSPNDELVAIVDWFREYMTSAGTNSKGNRLRDERAILFSYPERGWEFYIQVTNLEGFKYDREQYAAPWSITAEIVSDNALNYFKGITMSSFTDQLTVNRSLLGKIGMSAFADSTTETSNPVFGTDGNSKNPFINPDISGDAAAVAAKMGDNFQGLVAAWSTGNFEQFGFNALLDNGSLPKDVDAAYQKLFGTTYLGGLPGYGGAGSGGGTGTTTYGGPANPSSKDDIVLDIVTTFEGVGIAGKLGVAVALVETGGTLNPDDRQPNGDFAMGLFQTFPNGAGGTYHKAQLTQALINKDQPVTKYYPSGMQINDASKWFKVAKDKYYPNTDMMSADDDTLAAFGHSAQGAGDPNYTAKVKARISQAVQLINAAEAKNPSDTPGGVPTGLRLSVVNWGLKMIDYGTRNGRPSYSEGCRRDVENISPGDFSALPTSDCSNSVALLYCWGTNKDKRYGTSAQGFNSSTTETMWARWASQEIQPAQARAGDLVIYGHTAGDSHHVDMLLANYNGGSTPVFSHGSGVPHKNTYSNSSAYQIENGHPPHFFRILP